MSLQKIKKNWHPFEHKLWRELKKIPISSTRQPLSMLVAISGGADSMAMLHALVTFRAAARLNLSAMYVHHGDSENIEISNYRKKAALFCKRQCAALGVLFAMSDNSGLSFESEADFRKLRYDRLLNYQRQQNMNILVTAHHRDDLLETRLLRLIRGTGEGGLVAMKNWQANSFDKQDVSYIWRPFLNFSRFEIETYLRDKKFSFVEDPTNSANDYLRNWIRNEWLPQLEKKYAGSVESLARSLEIIAKNADRTHRKPTMDLFLQKQSVFEDGKEKHQCSISMSNFIVLDENEKTEAIVKLLKGAKVKSFSFGQVKEILKQLDKPQKIHKFTLSNSIWVVDAERVLVELR